VYVTGWSAGSKKYLAYLQTLIKATQINTVVIDVKDSSGMVSYHAAVPAVQQSHTWQARIADINSLVQWLHRQNIYVIGRIVVFEDLALAKANPKVAIFDTAQTHDAAAPVLWQDNNSLSWVDPSSKDVWNYNIAIANDAILHGFDEINFDYVRFPTDGDENVLGYPVWDQKIPKHQVIKNFFEYVRNALPQARISVDLFGQTTTNTDDMGIGQIFEDALDYVDYVCPMVYPSHYVDGFMGYENPADHPYDIILAAMDSALARQQVHAKVSATGAEGLIAPPDHRPEAKIRPWLQDFNLGAVYDASMVKKEIQAATDALGKDYIGYMLWSPSNIYTAGAIASPLATQQQQVDQKP